MVIGGNWLPRSSPSVISAWADTSVPDKGATIEPAPVYLENPNAYYILREHGSRCVLRDRGNFPTESSYADPGQHSAETTAATSHSAGKLRSDRMPHKNMTFEDVQSIAQPPPARSIRYGKLESQHGELFVPSRFGRRTALVLIHGGCWRSEYGLDHIRPLAHALSNEGFLVWSIEYRRLGEPGGGFPGTLLDVAKANDELSLIASEISFPLERQIAVGHSAGGQLALWLAGRSQQPDAIKGKTTQLDGVVCLAGVSDLRRAAAQRVCENSAAELLGDDEQARLSLISPMHLLPLGVRQVLIHGAEDEIVPVDYSRQFAARADHAGDSQQLRIIDNAGHFELIVPSGDAFAQLLGSLDYLESA